MCRLCVEIQKDKLTAREIASNYRELNDPELGHWVDVLVEIYNKGLLEAVSVELSKLREKENK